MEAAQQLALHIQKEAKQLGRKELIQEIEDMPENYTKWDILRELKG